MKEEKMQVKGNEKKEKKLSYTVLALIVLVVWLVLFIIKFAIELCSGGTIASFFGNLLNDVFDNLLGILPPIILFDIGLKYLNEEQEHRDMSKRITEAIMLESTAVSAFNDETKKKFIENTLDELMKTDIDRREIAWGAIKPYLDKNHDIRKNFEYAIEILNTNKNGFDRNKYIFLKEELSYESIHISSNPYGNSVHLGFFRENRDLDKCLRENGGSKNEKSSSNPATNKRYIIREGLTIANEEYSLIKSLSGEYLKNYINEVFEPVFLEGGDPWVMGQIEVTESGIDIEYVSPQKDDLINNSNTRDIQVSFKMPQLKTNPLFFASITQPTYSPRIKFKFEHKIYEVKTIPFFDKDIEISVGSLENRPGIREIIIKDKWVRPMSGVVFFVDFKEQNQ